MRSCSSGEEDDLYFDTREEITSVSDSGSECNLDIGGGGGNGYSDWVVSSSSYEVWIKSPVSVHERRDKFLKWMGVALDRTRRRDGSNDACDDEISVDIDRITEDSGAVLRNSDFGDEFSSSRSSMSCWSNVERDSFENGFSEENFVCRIKNLDDGTEFVVDELGQDGMLKRLREVGSNRSVTVEEFQRNLRLSPLVEKFMRRGVTESSNSVETTKRVKKGWLKRLGAVACIVNRQRGGSELTHSNSNQTVQARIERVGVRPSKKLSKEFSALYRSQDIPAHDGSILTMKFSPDGQFLASAGEDGVVRVWQVMENERSIEGEIVDTDPSGIYFTMNHSSKLSPLSLDKEKMAKFKHLRKPFDSACVILPPKVFRISEKPIHEFHGHTAAVLDLSWSKNKCLLSSSIDKTVRLWRVGCNKCLQSFSHNNYGLSSDSCGCYLLKCTEISQLPSVGPLGFNPVDDNYFISGSIDGKVRIWAISDCQVVDWTDVKEIVTAVCYRPNGQGGIVGSMNGNCYIYDASDNHLQLGAHLSLRGKKKSPGKRITGFEFSPSEPSKLMVTSADSQVRILDGVDVISKYKGLRNAGSQISASFTSDGKHIVSASEDSHVYIWNCNNRDRPAPSQAKSISSCERFFSSNASVAIPWWGMKSENSAVSNTPNKHSGCSLGRCSENRWQQCLLDKHSILPVSSPDCFSLTHGFFSESFLKGSATWPEEKLPNSSSLPMSSGMRKSQFKFLKNTCQGMFSSPHTWGTVIVTAGWDGHIRSFQNFGLPLRL